MMRRLRLLLVAALVLVVVGAGAGFGAWQWLRAYLHTPGPAQEPVVFQLEQGRGLAQIAQDLERSGLITHAQVFRVAARLLKRDRNLKAGEYVIEAGLTPMQILDLLESGRTIQHKVTVAEGLTVAEIMRLIAEHEVLEGELPELPPEGSILPETYFFTRGETRAAMVERMQAAMTEVLAELWPARAPDLPVGTPEEAVVLASIVEKETAVATERAKVAGVFVNRLRIGMPLQSDPTVIYALTDGSGPLDRPLTRADLKTDDPYNTYVYGGLPPGPIGNPGRASLEAVLQPDDVEALYFVADGSGGHAFARTLAEHNRNVAHWRRISRELGQARPVPERKPGEEEDPEAASTGTGAQAAEP